MLAAPLQAIEPLSRETPARGFERALLAVEQHAHQGEAEAACLLGEVSFHGLAEGEENAPLAVEWWTRATALGSVSAGLYLANAQLYGKGIPQDAETGLKRLQALADAGNARAARDLGRFHLQKPQPQRQEVEGLAWLDKACALGDESAVVEIQRYRIAQCPKEQRPEQALAALAQAADQGNAQAAHFLGSYLLRHSASEQDIRQGIAWLEATHASASAIRMRADAAYRLAMTYLDKAFSGHDPAEVIRWLNLSAQAGEARACDGLAHVYGQGILGALANPSEAFRWALRASRLGSDEGTLSVGRHLVAGEGVERDGRRGLDWVRQAATAGLGAAQAELAYLYWRNDLGETRNDAEIYKWARIAALQKNPMGMQLLGECYMRGVGIASDEQVALGWMTKSAEAGHVEARTRLATLYFYGIVVEVDYAEAAKWASLAAEAGDPDAECILGEMFVLGQGLEVDYAAGADWLRSAASKGNPRAQGLYGVLCAVGAGVAKNWIEALAWLKPAAREGDQRARDFLEKYGLGWTDARPEVTGEAADQATLLHPPKFPLRLFHGRWRTEGVTIEFKSGGDWLAEYSLDGMACHLTGSWRVHGDRLLMRIEASDQPLDDAYIEEIHRPATVLHVDARELLMEDSRDLSTIRYDRVIDEPVAQDATVLPFPGHGRATPEPHA